MTKNNPETRGDLSNLFARLEAGEEVTEEEAMLAIREGYFPDTSEAAEIMLEKIGIKGESDEGKITDKLKDLPKEYLRTLRHFLTELLDEQGKIDAIMSIEGSGHISGGENTRMMLRIIEKNLK